MVLSEAQGQLYIYMMRMWQQLSKYMRANFWICKLLIGECSMHEQVFMKKEMNFQSHRLSVWHSKHLVRKRSYSRWWAVVQPLVSVEYLSEPTCHKWRYGEFLTVMFVVHFTSRMIKPFSLQITLDMQNTVIELFKMIISLLEFCLLMNFSQGTE